MVRAEPKLENHRQDNTQLYPSHQSLIYLRIQAKQLFMFFLKNLSLVCHTFCFRHLKIFANNETEISHLTTQY